MKTIKVSSKDIPLGSGGWFVNERAPEDIVGRILTLLEALGLQHKQEEALKGLVKRSVYDIFGRDYGGRFLPSNLASCIYRLLYEEEEQARASKEVPSSMLDGDIEITLTPKE